MSIEEGKTFTTSQIAKAVGVHPNTVRLYEEWQLLQPVPRDEKGYRVYEERHLRQMQLARQALRCEFIAGAIREKATELVKKAAEGDLEVALMMAYDYLKHIQQERKKAEEALDLVKAWLEGKVVPSEEVYYKRVEVARLLGVSIDVLRNWEREGLIEIPRSDNNYRSYGPKELNRLKVIRTLRSANYSMMAVLRMMRKVDEGKGEEAYEAINTPEPEEDIIGATDRWIDTLIETEQDAQKVIDELKKMMDI